MNSQTASGLYVHFPFCRRKCAYCDFASIPCGGAVPEAGILDPWENAVLRELAVRGPGYPRFHTLYFGGGTPSLLPPDRLRQLIGQIRSCVTVIPEAEITLEANPCDLTGPDRIAALQEAGINRLSIGIQSFHDRELQLLERPHDGSLARRALQLAVASGMRVSADLIFGLPGQTPEEWRQSLREITDYGVRHISAYQLTWAAGTPLTLASRRGRIHPVPPEAEALFLQITHSTLSALGLPAYEVCSFAATAADRSQHNQIYWQGGDYLGLGPGAHSFRQVQPVAIRSWNPPSLTEYLRRSRYGVPAEQETLTPEQRALEMLFLGFRQVRGVDIEHLEQTTAVPIRSLNHSLLQQLLDAKLLFWKGPFLCPTTEGLFQADGLASQFHLSTC